MIRAWPALLLLAGCDRVFGTSPPAAVFDAAADLRWNTPVRELGFPTSGGDDPSLTADLRELYYNAGEDIWLAERASVDAPWSALRIVPALSSPAEETTPEVSGDGLRLVLPSARSGTTGDLDLMIATRDDRSLPWNAPSFLPAPLSSTVRDSSPSLTMDGTEIVFASTRTPDKVWTSRQTAGGSWAEPVPLASVNTIVGSASPFVTADGLAVYFNSYLGTTGAADLYVATRGSRGEAFSTPVPIEELNTDDPEEDIWVSPDGRHLYFLRHDQASGEVMLMHATR